MKLFLTIWFLSLFTSLFCQSDIFSSRNLNHLPRNNLSIFWNIGYVNSEYPLFTLEYMRIRKASLENNFLYLRNIYISANLNDFGKQTINFDKHILINSNDSLITQRSFGSGIRNFSMRIGENVQNRLVSNSDNFQGFQFSYSWYGIIGISNNLEQYIHINQVYGGILNGNFDNNIGNIQKLPIEGERVSHYLRLGFGASFGLDWVQNFKNKKYTTIGFNFNLVDFSWDFLISSKKKSDPDNFYSKGQDKTVPISNLGIGLRFGFSF